MDLSAIAQLLRDLVSSFAGQFLIAVVAAVVVEIGTRNFWAAAAVGLIVFMLLLVVGSGGQDKVEPSPTPFVTSSPAPTAAPSAVSFDCSSPMASPPAATLGPWTGTTSVRINPNTDGWVQADFWSSELQARTGFDEVSVIFEPWITVVVSDVAGTGWQYNRNCSRESIVASQNRHVKESLDLRQKRLLVMSPTDLCHIVTCS